MKSQNQNRLKDFKLYKEKDDQADVTFYEDRHSYLDHTKSLFAQSHY